MFLKSCAEIWDNPLHVALRLSGKRFGTKLMNPGLSMCRHLCSISNEALVREYCETPSCRKAASEPLIAYESFGNTTWHRSHWSRSPSAWCTSFWNPADDVGLRGGGERLNSVQPGNSYHKDCFLPRVRQCSASSLSGRECSMGKTKKQRDLIKTNDQHVGYVLTL